MEDNYRYKHLKNRCPRCSGYLYAAEYSNAMYASLFKDKVQCSDCARVWLVKNGELTLWY